MLDFYDDPAPSVPHPSVSIIRIGDELHQTPDDVAGHRLLRILEKRPTGVLNRAGIYSR
jgi:hypothetical protein